ncbi:PREDICTED: probable serine hydrolase isoform X3 [Nicrophorus vespilloides]|uniref:Probable serine hydrolase isoform X1 n=1 Tax=Nicrophorus vespilloides TaxID=110193 RepID=A0ABM1N3R9_NICVS|nr:PREDICTED: probable serine hydrolase isoform X1 [Nicrophorus vespilloides]XP_017781466.1 PREDICTED: probable serine hydrolase isoform X2 [Nicrophorus vespilloides]XP_017781467.1 PREDICTED: probable serine hydrolase isoform X1 [Nicrophorus vespilloides]XP_017781468.1 PREDICTED: probable serine hydrolase isoform X1 [Nicrophorus vespilloides]XP_017781469.1 PREDICTED: probable serine hydrolase isoform X1 [Nicrophorus vespilloides]XP_017781470.1 PREDICTED: probable serine hydrolase isoform X3 [N
MLSAARKLLSNIKPNITKLFANNDPEPKACVDVKIKVPWGNVCGKWWGPQDRRPILVIHAIKENCGSFDRLIPMLSNKIGFLTIDLPGHGKSSHLPSGMLYTDQMMLLTIHLIKNFFEWDRVSLMGHSSGAAIVFIYAVICPRNCDMAIFLDALYPPFPPKHNKMDTIYKDMERALVIQRDLVKGPPTTTLGTLERTMYVQSGKSIDLQNVCYLLDQGVVPSKHDPGTYHFSRDTRCNLFSFRLVDREDCLFACRHVGFPILITKTDDSPYFENEEEFTKFYKVLLYASRNCEVHDILGSHHVHLNEPEKIAKVVNKFLDKFDVNTKLSAKIDVKSKL